MVCSPRAPFLCVRIRLKSSIQRAEILCLTTELTSPDDECAGTDGVQLRGHRGGGGQVSRPQHDAQDDAEELVVSVLGPQRPRSRPTSPQVRLCAGYPCRVLQVPAPPHQLPRPRPLVVPSVTGHHGRVLLVLPHRRGLGTPARHRSLRIKPNKKRGGRNIRAKKA
jgi:hypothetical protein